MKGFKYKSVLGLLISGPVHTGGFNGASWKLPEGVCVMSKSKLPFTPQHGLPLLSSIPQAPFSPRELVLYLRVCPKSLWCHCGEPASVCPGVLYRKQLIQICFKNTLAFPASVI